MEKIKSALNLDSISSRSKIVCAVVFGNENCIHTLFIIYISVSNLLKSLIF